MCALTFNRSCQNSDSDNPIKSPNAKNKSKKIYLDNASNEMEQIALQQNTSQNDDNYSSEDDPKVVFNTDNIDENDKIANSKSITIAVNLSLGVNVLLLLTKVVVFLMTFSYAVIASLIDSVLDILSQFIIFLTERKVKKKDNKNKYPVGKTRLEPVGILTVSVLMVMLSVTVIRESIQVLITGDHAVEWSVVGISLLSVVVFLKFCLWLYCRRFKDNPIANALANDHINDVMSNAIALIVMILASIYPSISWLDPVGAIVISIWIIWSWYQTGKDEVKKLVGRKADDDMLKELRIVCDNHHKDSDLDVLIGYHIGRNILVEVEMIMPKETTLETTHDVCMDLQHKLEKFDFVERAFVHCDYKHRGFNEHKEPMLT